MSRTCHATSKRTRERCQAQAMPGKNVCYHHGGAPGSGRPISAYKGLLRYSDSLASDPEGKALYEKFRDDPDLNELGNEVALVRAKLARYLAKQGTQLDNKTLGNVSGFAEVIARIVEKRHKIAYGEQVTIRTRDFDVLADKLLEIAERIFGNDERYERFLTECRGLKLAAGARSQGSA